MPDQRDVQRLALQGGMKAVTGLEGQGKPKIGKEEFMAVVQRFGLDKEAMKRIKEAVSEEDFGGGPFLANYYSGLKETSVDAFARVAREIFGTRYAIPVSSGSAALHCAYVAAGVGPGAEVICSAIGFYATAMAIVQAKGVPIFCDVDESMSMDPEKIEALITPRTVAISPTQVMGSVCNMEAIMQIAKKHNLKVIEDCAQSCGGKYNDKFVGTWGDLGCFSISAYKIVGGGEGGLIITDDELLYERAINVAEGGGLWRPDRFGVERYPGELFVGTNYRMSELEAAVDAVQLKKMPAVVKRFNTVKNRITKQLKSYTEVTLQKINDPAGEVGYTLRMFPETFELGRQIEAALNAEGVSCYMRGPDASPDWHVYHHMFPITLQQGSPESHCPFDCPRYTAAGGAVTYQRGQCPVADDLFERNIGIGLNQWYTASDCKQIARAINKVLDVYCTAL